MLRGVDEVAKELKVSKTAIYNKLKLKEFRRKVVKKQGKSMIDEELFNLIKDSLKVKNEVKNEVEYKGYIEESKDEVKSEIAMDREGSLNLNKSLIDTLIAQLEEKDKQIAELHKLIENNQVLLKKEQETKINMLEFEDHFKEVDNKLSSIKEKMNQRKEKKSFFKNFFKK
ncbi:hypothetical protein ACQPUH_15175 [Clostridium perfringens]|uniref:hypothetical protein n=1 Tax=Clostridium perfringens TaxID=1502 RepID=UPI000F5357CF|nr:hypothetical protein [Clostridium perfringens]MDU4512733.1 hypothetical protein [Clostridioides difficile]EGT0689944.1 hypothetical protein [Clostridium perfringens]EHK2389752.1 hypothetical protein [Clostridium perfringens]EIF2088304.1 hypothetical protein [Clostridium perfringens]EIF6155526.1 hypothetical protein [Clostridium perfringens]